MKIAILNESFLNDKHINRLKQLGEVVVYSKTDTDELFIERLKDVEIAVADCYEAPLSNGSLYSKVPTLKFLTINSTGYDLVDIDAAKANGVQIAHVPGFSTEGVAEHTIALLLATVRHIPMGDKEMRKSPFQLDPANRDHDNYLGLDIKDKVLGVVGLGAIGTAVARLGAALGMQVIGHNRSAKEIDGVTMVTLDELLAKSDFVSLNVSLTEDSNELINEDRLKMMKNTAYIINTARSGIINDEALAKALGEGRLAGAGLDFLQEWSVDNPLLKLDNVVLTPHTGWFTAESLNNMAEIITRNVESFVNGAPENIVN